MWVLGLNLECNLGSKHLYLLSSLAGPVLASCQEFVLSKLHMFLALLPMNRESRGAAGSIISVGRLCPSGHVRPSVVVSSCKKSALGFRVSQVNVTFPTPCSIDQKNLNDFLFRAVIGAMERRKKRGGLY